MDKEYIERGAALLAITNDGCTVSNVGALMSVPTADVVEVVHGEWKEHPLVTGVVYCSNCGNRRDSVSGAYCSWCGAKMDGKGDAE